MPVRSQRTHKPTEKFIDYYSQEISPQSKKRNGKEVKQLAKIAPQTTRVKKVSIQGRRKLPNNEVQVLFQAESPSPTKSDSLSPEIRKSCRKQKPNKKLQDFYVSGRSKKKYSSPPQKIDFPGFEIKNSVRNKPVATVPPVMKNENIEKSVQCCKKVTVGLVDCLSNVDDKFNQSNFSNQINCSSISSSPSYETKNSRLDRESNQTNLYTYKNRRGRKRSMSEDSRISNGLDENKKHGLEDKHFSKGVSTRVKVSKEDKFSASLCSSSYNLSKRFKASSPNSSNHFTEDKDQSGNASGDEVLHSISSLVSPVLKPSKGVVSQKRNSIQKPPDDIRETLKKFLIMGTKVANAISETLKHNEEALLCRSSAFEKKCLSLVHALASRGADLEEDEMEKVLKLLDEEQEERKIYRHTFLESLRVSHLTNMALYSQMLRLLKTL